MNVIQVTDGVNIEIDFENYVPGTASGAVQLKSGSSSTTVPFNIVSEHDVKISGQAIASLIAAELEKYEYDLQVGNVLLPDTKSISVAPLRNPEHKTQ